MDSASIIYPRAILPTSCKIVRSAVFILGGYHCTRTWNESPFDWNILSSLPINAHIHCDWIDHNFKKYFRVLGKLWGGMRGLTFSGQSSWSTSPVTLPDMSIMHIFITMFSSWSWNTLIMDIQFQMCVNINKFSYCVSDHWNFLPTLGPLIWYLYKILTILFFVTFTSHSTS